MQLLQLMSSENAVKLPPGADKGTAKDGAPAQGFALLLQALWAASGDSESSQAGLEQAGIEVQDPRRLIGWLQRLNPEQLQQWSTEQLQQLDPEGLQQLNPELLQELSPEHLQQLDLNRLQRMDLDQLQQLAGLVRRVLPEEQEGVSTQDLGEALGAFLEEDGGESASEPAIPEQLLAMMMELFRQSGDAGAEGPMPSAGDRQETVPGKGLERPLAELLEALPEPLQTRLQHWAMGGKPLPPAATQAVDLPASAAPQQPLPWLQVAHKLLTGQAESGRGAEVAVLGAGDQDAGEAGADLADRFAARATATVSRTEVAPLTTEVRQEMAQTPEVGRLQELLAQVQDALAVRPAGMAAATASGGGLPQGGQPVALNSAPVPLHIAQPLGEPAWDRALGERILWMAGHQVQRAAVRLDPPLLGPVEIRVAVQNEQASVSFTAQHPFTREAIEAALPRLREMLADSSLNLVSVDVGQRDAGGSRAQQGRQGGFPSSGDGPVTGKTALSPPSAVLRTARGLVDDFA
jgi:hypothetical protein